MADDGPPSGLHHGRLGLYEEETSGLQSPAPKFKSLRRSLCRLQQMLERHRWRWICINAPDRVEIDRAEER